MSPSEDRDSVFREPQWSSASHPTDPSEDKARRKLDRESRGGGDPLLENQGVYDEPDIFPHDKSERIETDWSCSSCGYNLRGLLVGQPCPECAHVELYRPPPAGAVGYRTSLQQRAARVRPATAWLVAVGAALCGGLFAVFGAIFETHPGGMTASGLMLTILFAPVIEESMKIAIASTIVETRAYLFQRAGQIQLATIGSAAVFAVIENFIYLHVYISNPTTPLVMWRWTACIALHIGCTMVATRGLIDVWQRVMVEQRPARFAEGRRSLIVAMILHGAYNAAVMGYASL